MFASCIKKMQHQPLMKGVTPPQVACKPSKRSSHDTGNASASTTRTQVAPRERSGRTETSSIARSPKAKLPKLQFPLPKTRRQTGGAGDGERRRRLDRLCLVRLTTSGRGHVATGRRAQAVRLATGRRRNSPPRRRRWLFVGWWAARLQSWGELSSTKRATYVHVWTK